MKLNYLDSGSGRHVFVNETNTCVLKIPFNEMGISENYRDRDYFEQMIQNKSNFPIANCRIIPHTNCLLMEYVYTFSQIAKYVSNTPFICDGIELHSNGMLIGFHDWMYRIDNLQYGISISGNLVAYDP